jgi:hypothetical protein
MTSSARGVVEGRHQSGPTSKLSGATERSVRWSALLGRNLLLQDLILYMGATQLAPGPEWEPTASHQNGAPA